VLETIAKEETRDRLSSKLGPLPRRKQDIASTPKHPKVIIARWGAMETLTRTTILKIRGGLDVDDVDCSANGISPKMGRN